MEINSSLTGPLMYRNMVFSSGIKAELMHYSLADSIVSSLETPKPVFGFGFCVSGYTRSRISCFKDELEIRGGESAVFYFPEIKVWSQTSSKEAVWRMTINIPQEILRGMVESDIHGFPQAVKDFAFGKSNQPFRLADKITPAMRQLMMQILNCPYKGSAASFFTEAKVMELIACKIDGLGKSRGKNSSALVSIKKEDIDRLYYAKEILSSRLEDPPELGELSKISGISRTKLIKGFGHVFGKTPGAYLRELRLEKARDLLIGNEKNLTEIALMVGYSSSSHFTKVFKAHYGVPPSVYARMN